MGVFIFNENDRVKITNKKLGLNEEVKKGSKSKKKLRRNLNRLADRKQISYEQAILDFYKVSKLSDLDKNLVFSLQKKRKGRRPRKNVAKNN